MSASYDAIPLLTSGATNYDLGIFLLISTYPSSGISIA